MEERVYMGDSFRERVRNMCLFAVSDLFAFGTLVNLPLLLLLLLLLCGFGVITLTGFEIIASRRKFS